MRFMALGHATGENSMSNIIPFQFETQSIRVVTNDNGEPWFNAREICDVLGYGNPHQALSTHVDGDDLQKLEVIDSIGRKQLANHINESGLYALIFGSTKDEAKRFKRWVTHEVLPAIRKTGAYIPPQQKARTTSLPSPVRDILAIGRELRKVKGMTEAVATAATLETIRINTGLDVTPMAKSLPSVELADIAKLNATEVGEPLNLKARAVNAMLINLGMAYRDDHKEMRLTEAGTAFGEMKPYHRNGHTGYEIRWKESVIDLLKTSINQQPSAA
jgi:prophage antirepressor-like protein